MIQDDLLTISESRRGSTLDIEQNCEDCHGSDVPSPPEGAAK